MVQQQSLWMEIYVYRLCDFSPSKCNKYWLFHSHIQSSSSSALGLMMMTDKRSISSLLKSFTGVCSDTPAPAENTHTDERLGHLLCGDSSSVLHKSWRNEISLDLPPSDRQADSFSSELAYLYWTYSVSHYILLLLIKLDPVSSRWHEIIVRKLIS